KDGRVQGTVKRFGDFESPEYILSNTGTFERGLSANWGLNRFNFGFEAYYSFFKNEIGILRASHLGGAQDQIRAIESSIPLIVNDFDYAINAPMQEIDHHLFRIKGFKRLKGLGKLSLQYDFQKNDRLEFDIRRGSDRNKASLDLELDTHSLQFDLNTSLTADLNLKTGLLSRYQNNFAEPNTGVRRLIPDYKKYDLGVFSILNYRPNNQWIFEAGARFDFSYLDVYKYYRTSFWEFRNYDELFPELVVRENINQILTHPELKFYNPSATVGVHFNFDQDFNLLLNYSVASRAPNPSELFSEGLHHSASRIELGDLRFQSERGHKVSLTLERDEDRFGFSINPFYQSIIDFIILEPTAIQQTVRGNFQVWEYRQTHAELLGLDLDLMYRFSNTLSIQHQSSLVKGYDRIKDEALISMPPVNTSSEIVYQNPKYKNIRLALQSAYFFRQNEYPNVNFEVYIPQEEQFKLVDVSTPPDAYHLLNFSSSIDLKSVSFGLFSIDLTITNLLNTSYRNYLNRLRFYADDLGRNFLIKLKFNY
ncbi:MAG: TonB-dependent receptor, partial [Flavobacteriaceae bacterium]